MAKCIPVDTIPTLVERILTQAGATKALRQKVTQSISEIQYVGGQVSLVETYAGEQIIFVTDATSATGAGFRFPQNRKVFQDELIRAQDSGRIVIVSYRNDSKSGNIIDSVDVYAGASVDSPRYYIDISKIFLLQINL